MSKLLGSLRGWARLLSAWSGAPRTRRPAVTQLNIEPLESRDLPSGGVFAMHIHPHLTIIMDGENKPIPAELGIIFGEAGEVHTHDTSGTLHVESEEVRTFILGEFFDAWDRSLANAIGTTGTVYPANLDHETRCRLIGADVRVTLNGQPASSDFRSIVMNDLDRIVINADVAGALPPVVPGDFSDPSLLGTRTDLLPGAPAITQDHVTGVVDYTGYSNPPTYGPHHPSPLTTGVYATVQDDADLVHNLEHGHVWISYNPTLLGASRSDLEQLVRSFGSNVGVVLTPRPANTRMISLASWAHLLELDSFDAARIREFVITNRGHAPEGFITP